MPEVRMKKRISVCAIAGLAIVFSSICSCKGKGPTHPTQTLTGPPVIVLGGSLFGQAPEGWMPYSKCDLTNTLEWCYDIPNGTQDHLYSDQYSPAISLSGVDNDTSWTVHISDKDSQGNGNQQEGILLCGNADCNVKAKSNLDKVYIKPFDKDPGHSEWINRPADYLFYQDKTCNPNGNCEHPDSAILSTASGQVSPPSKCTAPKAIGCSISVGSPAQQP